MQPEGVQAGVAEENFGHAPGGRVFGKYCLDVFSQRPEHLSYSRYIVIPMI
jgi:hypothetical protein